MLHLYNSLTRKKEPFSPLLGKDVKMYVCGITPYDTTHLGHAFTYISFDVLKRLLEYKGYHVEYTQNVTDIDDDILKRAKKEGKDWKKLGEFWTNKFLNDMKQLRVHQPTYYVKATESMETIIKIIEQLVSNGIAYERKGNVYFSVDSFREYGKLSRLTKKQMILISKERGADPDDPNKNNPLDFILWQKSRTEEPFWKSPWGKGRPGWHIECSAMNYDYLGERIDIHGGGHDLMYPHHESEIAQSESYTRKKPFAAFWMHTAMLLYDGEKMSKSLGNLIMVSDLLKKYSPDAIRYVLLSHHYRSPWQFEQDELEEAENNLQKVRHVLSKKRRASQVPKQHPVMKRIIATLDDDLNTPEALQQLQAFSDKLTKSNTLKDADIAVLQTGFEVLGFSL
jgi:L-cysteine:1D-myo-inositol 2-amino-2-deoxy-alpha-D-glucopyranoside ligase